MNNRKIVFILCFLIAVFGETKAQNTAQNLDSLLTTTLDSMRTVLNVKSLSAAMKFSDTSVWAHANGISSLMPLDSVTTNSVYLIGSITKTITAACILQLAENGILNLDDSLHEWLDTFQFINPNITIQQLLRHQSGIYEVLSNPNCQPTLIANPDSVWALEDLITTFVKPPLFAPGTNWSYCSTGYYLLAMIIKEATGFSYYQELRNRFFTPLAMSSLAIPAFETITLPTAHVWLDLNGDGITDDADWFYMSYFALNSTAGPAGGYFATPTDITRWMWTYMRGDLLSTNMMSLAKVTVAAPGLPGATYGLGLMKKTFNSLQGYGHGGDLAYAASSWYFPTKDVSITVFTNDSKNNSWTLAPVISALLKQYTTHTIPTSSGANTNAEPLLIYYPNPFKNELSFVARNLKEHKKASMILYSNLGQEVARCEKLNDGSNATKFEFTNLEKLGSGIYFGKLMLDGVLIKTIKVTNS